MIDLISRRAAIEALESIGSLDTDADREYARGIFNALPSAQPERKKGQWILVSDGYTDCVKCDKCGEVFDVEKNFCPNCGADMRGEQDE